MGVAKKTLKPLHLPSTLDVVASEDLFLPDSLSILSKRILGGAQ